jgi:hypothetical protein
MFIAKLIHEYSPAVIIHGVCAWVINTIYIYIETANYLKTEPGIWSQFLLATACLVLREANDAANSLIC